MKKKITNSILVTAFLAALVSPVFALEGEGWYMGASIGSAEFDDACTGDADIVFGSCDDSDTGWKLFSGYKFTQNWGAEVYYADFGEAKANGTFEGAPFTADAEVNVFGIAAIGTWPINDQFDVFGKVGISRWDVDVSASGEGITGSVDDDGTDVTVGIGASYSFNKQFAIRVEWELNKVGDDGTTGEDDIGLLSIGGVLSF